MSSKQPLVMSSNDDVSVIVADPFEFLQIKLNSDGTLTRFAERLAASTPAESDPSLSIPVLSKDLPINDIHGTWFRIFLPRDRVVDPPGEWRVEKLPLVVYFHGGGFIFCSAASTIFQRFHHDLASGLPAVIVSVEYRLAPEHRLPAAYEDAVEALLCIVKTKDEWLTRHADFSNCYLMGSSAGGNIAYNAGLRAACMGVDEFGPLGIRGMMLHHPYFGGEERTESESRLFNDQMLPRFVCDLTWQLALPIGSDRDHKYCNPGSMARLDRMKLLEWKVFITGCKGDPTIDRQVALVDMLNRKGIPSASYFSEGEYHGFDIIEAAKTRPLVHNIKKFISGV